MNGVRRSAGRLLLASFVALAAMAAVGAVPGAGTAAAIPRWTGAIDLYRTGVFTTQKTWLWCTAADVQIAGNIADRAADHSRSSQQRYFDAMRAHDRYEMPLSDGVDPAGWAYGMRHFVDGRYRLVASRSFNAALRAAVTNLRRTKLPVGITVAHGDHAWLLTGFSATADPAATTRFTVTSVRVVGPLWGLQSTSYGYDMRPDTKLTPKQLAGFFTPWHYAKIRMAWEGDWVSIQPIAARAGSPAPTPAPTPKPHPVATATPRPTATPMPIGSASVVAAPDEPTPRDVAVEGGVPSTGPATTAPATSVVGSEAVDQSTLAWLVAGGLIAIAIAVSVGRGRRAGRRPRAG
jgi:hypothetical protein